MKKQSFKLLLVSIFSILTIGTLTAFPMLNMNSEVPTTSEEDEAIHCKVYGSNGNVIAECWLCNCGKLIEAMH